MAIRFPSLSGVSSISSVAPRPLKCISLCREASGDGVQICVQEVRGPHQTPAARIDGRNPAESESCESHKAAMMNVCGPGSKLREVRGVWPYPLLISDPTQRL